jgi:hypothetical protein
MSSIRENSQAQSFISVIFEIVAKSLNSARSNNQEIGELLKDAGEVVQKNQSVDVLFEKLASEIKNDSDTIAMIYGNLSDYKLRINNASISMRKVRTDKDFIE